MQIRPAPLNPFSSFLSREERPPRRQVSSQGRHVRGGGRGLRLRHEHVHGRSGDARLLPAGEALLPAHPAQRLQADGELGQGLRGVRRVLRAFRVHDRAGAGAGGRTQLLRGGVPHKCGAGRRDHAGQGAALLWLRGRSHVLPVLQGLQNAGLLKYQYHPKAALHTTTVTSRCSSPLRQSSEQLSSPSSTAGFGSLPPPPPLPRQQDPLPRVQHHTPGPSTQIVLAPCWGYPSAQQQAEFLLAKEKRNPGSAINMATAISPQSLLSPLRNAITFARRSRGLGLDQMKADSRSQNDCWSRSCSNSVEQLQRLTMQTRWLTPRLFSNVKSKRNLASPWRLTLLVVSWGVALQVVSLRERSILGLLRNTSGVKEGRRRMQLALSCRSSLESSLARDLLRELWVQSWQRRSLRTGLVARTGRRRWGLAAIID